MASGVVHRWCTKSNLSALVRKAITKRAVDALKPGEFIADDELRGFVVRRLPSRKLSYGFRYTKHGRRRWINIGVGIAPHDARNAARILAGKVAKDGDPLPERQARRLEARGARTIDDVLDDFLKEHAKARQLRSSDDVESLMRRFIRPKLGSHRISELKRSEIVALLDEIAARPSASSRDGLSRRVADKVLGVMRSAFNWHASRDDEFRSPIVPRMVRTSLKELSRDRILSDDEVRFLWKALDKCQPRAYARIVRILLLSGARLNEIARMKWSEIVGDVLTVSGARTKSKTDHVLPVTFEMATLIGERAEDTGAFVFSTNGGSTPFSGFSKAKRQLDEKLAELLFEKGLPPMSGWRLHDLRRTARSLLSRAGVSSDIAERLLGHAMPGIRGVYDRHRYVDEKREALKRLAILVHSIVDPPLTNVASIRPKARRNRKTAAHAH